VAKAPGHNTSDRELVAAMARGDADALRALSARYARMLGALAYRFVKDESDAEEIAADALWQAWREAPRFDPSRSSVSAWLVMLGRSRAIDRFRAARARRPPENPQPQPAPVADALSELEAAQRAKIVKTAVGELEPRERELLELAYFSDLSQAEIAEKVGIPLGTVKTRMRTALIKLRDALRRLR
jgi:RNA polymerase sigma-70 factor, ECF subfamily